MTIVEYLKSKVDFSIGDSSIYAILLDRGCSPASRASDFPFQTRELLFADLLMYGANITESSIRRGDFSRTQGKIDAISLRREANDIYKKYGDSKFDSLYIREGNVKWVEEYE